ncbi:hypothetical protein DOTSEDRAFT_70410 [Dothistroma septosporum NZE10]|uniref:Uncharacterized protein n=1 Tax=Dothistroma septosporum (strain NZE10 / CBS 128990) TaxID=675120 RepID=N1PSP0_DOTSN|nr:hypothetical protein DOTSEDRAFT_70410 [Dothistroma septosporum NZE10]
MLLKAVVDTDPLGSDSSGACWYRCRLAQSPLQMQLPNIAAVLNASVHGDEGLSHHLSRELCLWHASGSNGLPPNKSSGTPPWPYHVRRLDERMALESLLESSRT